MRLPLSQRLVVGAFVVLTAGPFLTAACDKTETRARGTSDDRSTTTERDEPPASREPTTTTTVRSVVHIGAQEWFEWTDGIQAQVTSLTTFVPDYDDSPGVPDVVATITVKNGSPVVYDATQATASLYGGPNGVQADEEYSFYGFEGSIPPGATATAKWAWALPQEHFGQVRVEFAPSYEHYSGFFEGAVS